MRADIGRGAVVVDGRRRTAKGSAIRPALAGSLLVLVAITVGASACGGSRPHAGDEAATRCSPREAPRSARPARGVAITAARDYLLRAIKPDGRVAYRVGLDGRERGGYNVVRHAGSLFALAVAARAAPAPGAKDAEVALARGLAGLGAFAVPWRDAAAGLARAGKIKLGGVALASLAASEAFATTGEPGDLGIARRYAGYLLDALEPGGAFVHQRGWPSRERLSFVSRYYPGEAILALARLFEQSGEEGYLEAATRAARYLIEVRDATLSGSELDHDHWLLYGLEVLDRCAADERWWRHAIRIADAIAGAVISDDGRCVPVHFGSDRAAPIATRIEGLMAAVRMAERRHDGPRADRWRAVAGSVEPSLLASQVMTGPALGGFTGRPGGAVVRIDVVQHALSALLALELDRTRRSDLLSRGRCQHPSTESPVP